MEEKNNGLITIAAEGTVTISTEEYANLVKRSFALDLIIANYKDSGTSYKIGDTISYVVTALSAPEESEASEDA